jgi:hypothetical protein
MKKNLYFYLLTLVGFLSLSSCEFLKTEDEKIKEAIIGKYYEDDNEDDEAIKIKDSKGEYFDDGTFFSEAAYEFIDEETFESTDIVIEVTGNWDVKDGFLFLTPDYDAINISPEIYEILLKDKLVETMKDTNSPYKIIEYDASKVIYEDADGVRTTMKKSY